MTAFTSQVPRRGPAAVLLLCSVACAVLVVAAGLAPGGTAVRLTCAHWLLSGWVAVLGTLLARGRAPAGDRAGWNLLLVSNVLWLLAVAVYDVFTLTRTFPPSPTVSDLMWLGAGVVSAVGLRRLARSRSERRTLSWMELTPLGAAVCVLLLALLWPDITRSGYGSAAIVTILAYPIVYVSTALVMLQAVVSGSLSVRRNGGLGALLLGLVVEAVTFVAWAPPLLHGTYEAGHSSLDPWWTIGMILVGVGAWTAQPIQKRLDTNAFHNRGGVLPTASFLLLSVVQILSTVRIPRQVTLSIGVGLVGVLLALRGSALRRSNALLRLDSRTDPLMGIANRLELAENLDSADEHARSHRDEDQYAVALFDLDHFKAYNDLLGHPAGDLALQTVAGLLDRTCRDDDRIYRYGGEELLVLINGVDVDRAGQITERLRKTLEQARLPHPGNDPYEIMTVSAGVARVRPGETPQQVTQRADEALYRAKAGGRNRVVTSGSPAGEPPATPLPRPRAGEHDAAVPADRPGG